MRHYVAVGDIHGEFGKLAALLDFVGSRVRNPFYIFLGDYLDKGSQSRKVMDCLLSLKKKSACVCLKGDHEYQWLRALRGNRQAISFLRQRGGDATLRSYGLSQKKIALCWKESRIPLDIFPDSHLDFLRRMRYYYEPCDIALVFVHGGIVWAGKKPLSEQKKEDLVFIRDEFVNRQKKQGGKRIVFGHTAFRKVFYDGSKIGIDTGAVYGRRTGYGTLSAFDCQREVVYTDAGKEYPLRAYKEKINRALKVGRNGRDV